MIHMMQICIRLMKNVFPHYLINKKGTNDANIFRSSHLRCSVNKVILKNFAIFTAKHLCWCLLVKMQAFSPATVLKRNSNLGVFL